MKIKAGHTCLQMEMERFATMCPVSKNWLLGNWKRVISPRKKNVNVYIWPDDSTSTDKQEEGQSSGSSSKIKIVSKIALAVFKEIFSAIFGDPITLIPGLAGELASIFII